MFFFNIFKSKTEPTVWLASDIALIYVHLEQDNISLVVQSPKTSAYVYFIPVRGGGSGARWQHRQIWSLDSNWSSPVEWWQVAK